MSRQPRCHEVSSARIPCTQPRHSRKESRAASYSASKSMQLGESVQYQSTVRAGAVRSMQPPQKRSAGGGLIRRQAMEHPSLARSAFLSVFASNPSGSRPQLQSCVQPLAICTLVFAHDTAVFEHDTAPTGRTSHQHASHHSELPANVLTTAANHRDFQHHTTGATADQRIRQSREYQNQRLPHSVR